MLFLIYNNHVHYICGKYVTFHLFFSMLQSLYTFSVNDLIENGTKSPNFLFESSAPHSGDHLRNKYIASGDVRLYHVERSSKLTPK